MHILMPHQFWLPSDSKAQGPEDHALLDAAITALAILQRDVDFRYFLLHAPK